MVIRTATLEDALVLSQIEAACFPDAEAASLERIRERLEQFQSHFWVAEIASNIVGFINGMVTDSQTIQDVMYEDASMHKEDGQWQSVFGLDVLVEHRKQGIARKLMQTLIADAKNAGRKGCILTCKEHLIQYYETFGYECLGTSQSVHGGATWYDMILTFESET